MRQGETIASIAVENKFRRFETIWDDGENKPLRDLRKNPNVLEPGDIVMIPDRDESSKSAATGARHTYFTTSLTQRLLIRCESPRGTPLASKPYKLTIDGADFSGTTKSDGMVEHDIPVRSKTGRLEIEGSIWPLDLGFLNPVDEETKDDGISGAQGRLRNLGYYFGPVNGKGSDAFTNALSAFETEEKLSVTGTGEVSSATAKRLRERHGC